jgi:DNA-binding MarR family transcriptional regulator
MWLTAARRLEASSESIHVWQVLNALRNRGPMTQCELATRTGQHAAGVSRLLETLEREGGVARQRDTDDRRKVRVELTDKGRLRLAAIDPEVAAASEQVLAPLGPEERGHLERLLTKLIDAAPETNGQLETPLCVPPRRG